MSTTLKTHMFVPEVATQVASAVFPNELALRFAGSPFVRSFPVGALNEGDTVKFPRYSAMSGFSALTENLPMTPQLLQTAVDTATVQAAGMAVEVTDFASLASRGDPSAEIGRQAGRLAAEFVDSALITEAETTALSVTPGATITWDNFVTSLFDNWGDKAFSQVGGVVVHSKVMGDLMKLAEFKTAEAAGVDLAANRNGLIGRLAGLPVYMSDRLTVTSGTPDTYTCLVLKQGSLGLQFQRELLVESDRDILAKNTVVAADVRFAVHLFYDNPSPALKLIYQ
jgi:hypothetical protein